MSNRLGLSGRGSWLDQVISYVSPQTGLERARARLALRLTTAYEATAPSRQRQIRGLYVGPNVAAGTNLGRLREMARHAERNQPLARRAIRVWTANLIGTGIRPEPQNDRLLEAWNRWSRSKDCDFYRQFNVYGLQRQCAKALCRDGEVLVRQVPGDRRNMEIPLSLQVLEADHIDTFKTGPTQGGGYIHNGVEFDATGRLTYYWLFEQHPSDLISPRRAMLSSRRVPVEQIIHLFDPERPGQLRGVTWLAAILKALTDHDEYMDALMMRAKIEACLTGVFTQPDQGQTPLSDSQRQVGDDEFDQFRPGQIIKAPPGHGFEFADPKPSQPNDYLRAERQDIATGADLSYDQLSGDLREANYASLRAGKIEFRAQLKQLQTLVVSPQLCDPMWDWFVLFGAWSGQWRQETAEVQWMLPRAESIDALKDIQAELAELEAGGSTWGQFLGRRGLSSRRQLKDIASEQEAAEDEGFSLPVLKSPSSSVPSGQSEDDDDDAEDSEDDGEEQPGDADQD